MTLFSGGGGGGGAAAATREWLRYIQEQQAEQELSEARIDEQAETLTDYRRNELADRSGYAGLVNVGSAVQETDATLAARMQLLAPGDPQRTAYDTAITSEAAKKAGAQRIITGEQYEVEDKFSALTKDLEDDTSVEDIQKRLDSLGTLAGQYNWYDSASIKDDLAKRLKKAQQREAGAASAAEQARNVVDGGSAASGGAM